MRQRITRTFTIKAHDDQYVCDCCGKPKQSEPDHLQRIEPSHPSTDGIQWTVAGRVIIPAGGWIELTQYHFEPTSRNTCSATLHFCGDCAPAVQKSINAFIKRSQEI